MPSAAGGLPFSLSSGKGKKQQNNPENPARPACPVEPGTHRVFNRGETARRAPCRRQGFHWG